MSSGQDDYGSATKDSTQFITSHSVEPADPDRSDHNIRRNQSVIPESVNSTQLPDPFRDDKTGEPLTVGEAGKTYLQIQLSNLADDRYTSKHERHKKGMYPRILHADRHFQAKFDSLTTVLLTRRLSPLDDDDNWLTPWECNEMLHGGSIHESIRMALDYHLADFDFEWIAETAPTRSAGTPHEHIYLWIDDPNDEVTTDQIAPALNRHLEHCPNASEKHHQYQSDGTSGAITVQHSPDKYRNAHKTVAKHVMRGDTPPYATTSGAQYLASQLVHLHVGDYERNQDNNPPQALFEGAALAWISPHNWYRSSQGVPS